MNLLIKMCIPLSMEMLLKCLEDRRRTVCVSRRYRIVYYRTTGGRLSIIKELKTYNSEETAFDNIKYKFIK